MTINFSVKALVQIAEQLGKKDWNFNVDPCTSNDQIWITTQVTSRPFYYNETLICNCNYTDGVCHILKIKNLCLTDFLEGRVLLVYFDQILRYYPN
ncbi:hypothetical protein ACB092_05G135000 [Castanea dentata]